ncbi:MAG: hypothetical protein FWD80_03610 [Propionibacteriaceae bacterium]|nr:hypothetical protein [Propionibacteriaceae bacterium]
MSDEVIDPVVAVVDRATSSETLAAIAREYPHTRVLVASHPNVDPDLLDWLDTHGSWAVQRVVAKRRAAAQMSLAQTTVPDSAAIPVQASPGDAGTLPPTSPVASTARPARGHVKWRLPARSPSPRA